MQDVSQAWEISHGLARGFSIGRFDRAYLERQKLLFAWHEGHLVGFISLHITPHEWCLDLMRALPNAPDGAAPLNAPDGAMHLLVHTAIQQARAANVRSFSLASVPALPAGRSRLENWLRKSFDKRANGLGLRQFKRCFAPVWKPQFMAAPSWMQLVLAGCDLIRSVRFERPPQTVKIYSTRRGDFSKPNDDHEQNAIALDQSA